MKQLLPLFAMLAACSPEQGTLDQAKADWATTSEAITDYSYDVRYSCFCPQAFAHVQVLEGTIVVEQTGDLDVPPNLVAGVEGLHAQIQLAIDDRVDELIVDYDSDGVPMEVRVDVAQNALDDEWGFTVSNFVSDQPSPY